MLFLFNVLVASTIVASPISDSAKSHGVEDQILDRVTDDFIRFERVYSSRNLRGLFPSDEKDLNQRKGASGDADISEIGEGGQVSYVTDIKFGDQGPFKVIIDTGSSDTWLVGREYRCLDEDLKKVDKSECRLAHGYAASSTFTQNPDLHFAIQYGDGERLFGAVGTETVRVGTLEVANQRINVVDNASWNGDNVTSGLLGLGLPANTANYRGTRETDLSMPVQYDPFFTSAMKNGAAPAGSFAIALQRDNSTAGQGYLSFGGIPPVRTYGAITNVKFAPPRVTPRTHGLQSEYTVRLDGFRFAGIDATAYDYSGEGLIDSGTSVLLAPAAIARSYNAQWDPNTQEAPPFSVVIGGREFPIDPADLKIKTSKGYASAVMPARKTILGDTFMRNVVSVFDIAGGQMRFASTNPQAGPENPIRTSWDK